MKRKCYREITYTLCISSLLPADFCCKDGSSPDLETSLAKHHGNWQFLQSSSETFLDIATPKWRDITFHIQVKTFNSLPNTVGESPDCSLANLIFSSHVQSSQPFVHCWNSSQAYQKPQLAPLHNLPIPQRCHNLSLHANAIINGSNHQRPIC